MIDEISNIINNNQGEQPSNGHLIFSIINLDNPNIYLKKVKEIAMIIAKQTIENYPSDEEWDKLLPEWFLKPMKERSIEELIQSKENIWHYASWTDNLRYRGWVWYSSKTTLNGFDIILDAFDIPYNVNAFEYIIYATGVPFNEIKFIEVVEDI